MNLTKYVKKFGQFTFKEKPFNDVDALVLATAVYSNFEVVAPSIYDHKNGAKLFKDIFKFDLTIVTAGRILVDNRKLIPAMRESKRFGNIGIQYINKVLYEEFVTQFYACSFIIPDVGTYVAFRGTDSSIIGWKENLNLSIQKVVLAQLDAVDYLNLISNFVEGPIYIGGHSKGGNLALYAAVHCPKNIQDRIVKVFSFDGNGMSSPDYLFSKEYKNIEDKVNLICPYDSVVGQIMYNPKPLKVVKSKGLNIMQHDSHKWIIDKNGNFKCALTFKKKSVLRGIIFKKWLDSIPRDDRLLMINFLTVLFGGLKQTIFDYIFSFSYIRGLLKAKKQFTKDEKLHLKSSLQKLKICKKEAKLEMK